LPAPLAQVDIQKVLGGEYWTNRYLISLAPGTTEAETCAMQIAEAERNLYPVSIRINRIRISTALEGDTVFQSWDPGYVGNRNPAPPFMLPLFCIVRVDFGAGLGRPSRKYLRGALHEDDVEGSALTQAFKNAVVNPYANTISGLACVVDPQGDDLNGFTVASLIGMRQLRRGSKRRATPVI
jgi:hypothetical protein